MHAGPLLSVSSPLPGFTGFVKARRQKPSAQQESIPTPRSALTWQAQEEAGSLETLGAARFAQRVLCCRAVRPADLHTITLVSCPGQKTDNSHDIYCRAAHALLIAATAKTRNGKGCQLKSMPADAQRPYGWVAAGTSAVFSVVCDRFPCRLLAVMAVKMLSICLLTAGGGRHTWEEADRDPQLQQASSQPVLCHVTNIIPPGMRLLSVSCTPDLGVYTDCAATRSTRHIPQEHR